MILEYLTLFISLKCTHACIHCIYGCNPNTGEDMQWDTFIKSVDIAKQNSIPKINFFGGEPFVNTKCIEMIEYALVNNFSIIIATNCVYFEQEKIKGDFLDVTGTYKDKILITVGNDKYHKKQYNPQKIATELQNSGYKVILQDYSNHTIILTNYNKNKIDNIASYNTEMCCCNNGNNNQLGILPNGEWTICPPSITGFGSINSISYKEINNFKESLDFNYTKGCSRCLEKFDAFHEIFLSDFAPRPPAVRRKNSFNGPSKST